MNTICTILEELDEVDEMYILDVINQNITTKQIIRYKVTLCEMLIREGLAYGDDTDHIELKIERDANVISKNRDNTIEKNLEMLSEMLSEMKKCSKRGQRVCIRIKSALNYKDPIIYKCNLYNK